MRNIAAGGPWQTVAVRAKMNFSLSGNVQPGVPWIGEIPVFLLPLGV